MAKKVSWMYGGKRYYGTFIRETKEKEKLKWLSIKEGQFVLINPLG